MTAPPMQAAEIHAALSLVERASDQAPTRYTGQQLALARAHLEAALGEPPSAEGVPLRCSLVRLLTTFRTLAEHGVHEPSTTELAVAMGCPKRRRDVHRACQRAKKRGLLAQRAKGARYTLPGRADG